MSKLRRAVRALIGGGACLVAGAFISVAVATAIGLWGAITAGVIFYAQLERGQVVRPSEFYFGTATRDRFDREPVPPDLLPPYGDFFHYTLRGPGVTDTLLAYGPVKGGNRAYRISHRTGWPFRAMGYRSNDYAPSWSDDPSGWRAPDWICRQEYFAGDAGWRGLPRPPVPLRPIPSGLAFNSVFYGGILLAIVALAGPGRSAVRRWRGRCPACGYSRAGLTADAACPECGRKAEEKSLPAAAATSAGSTGRAKDYYQAACGAGGADGV